jgi:hypothetical protein
MICSGCGKPITIEARGSWVEYRETVGLQEWQSWYYHTEFAPSASGLEQILGGAPSVAGRPLPS